MSIGDLFFRLKQILKAQYEKHFVAGKDISNVAYKINSIPFELNEKFIEEFEYKINVFGKEHDFSSGNIDWHTDIFSNRSFPRTFSKSINMRHDPDLSAKVVWELNRMPYLNFIALNYKSSGDRQHLILFMKIISSWKEDNPYLIGVNWYSNIEVNIRLIVWYYAWKILDAEILMEEDPEFEQFVNQNWIPLIYQHCKYSHANPSKYSSANNHLVSEYAGLFVSSSLWEFEESKSWNNYAKKGLEREINLQHSSKGVNKEEAAEYIQFATDFFLISYAVAENSNNSFSTAYKNQLYNISDYIFDMLDNNGRFPQYGDEDDGAVLLFEQAEHQDNFRSILSSAAVIFNDPKLKAGSRGPDLKNAILFGCSFEKKFEDIKVEELLKKSAFYAEEGHFFIKKQDENSNIYIHFDAAPLGYLSIAAHGHADALSFILHVNGKPVNVDSGTYTYHTEPEWRKYFIGTLAHNTLRINRQNQATIAGPTMWLNHFSCKVLKHESNDSFDLVKASHNGYKNIGIEHQRELYFDKGNSTLTIIDKIISQNSEKYIVEFPLHFHPDCKIELGEDNFLKAHIQDDLVAEYEIDKKYSTTIIYGQEKPEILGWYSPSFMKKTPTNTLLCSVEIDNDISFTSKIKIH